MNTKKPSLSRRKFLRNTIITGAAGVTAFSAGGEVVKASKIGSTEPVEHDNLLYNGIFLPDPWPPRNMKFDTYDPLPLPYLASPPTVIPVDTGRQLFVDDFLIEYTDMKREFHQPVKSERNPLLKPETRVEMNKGYCPNAAPFSDGIFYDPQDKLFKMWYMAGWFDGTALATSTDGINWERPALDVVPGTNLVLDPEKELGRPKRRDGASVWLDHDAINPDERFKMYWWARQGEIGERLSGGTGFLLTSPDGIHWNWRGNTGRSGDNSTFFYNPFRKKWVFTVRTVPRPSPPWVTEPTWKNGRSRSYWENSNLFAALNGWDDYDPVFWFGADRYDAKRENYDIGGWPQIYKVDAVGYESLMIGLIQPHYGPENAACARGGFPKLTELQVAFSRDGFHWDRTNRKTFIGATLEKNSWERAYIHSIGGVCLVVNDKLYFYYTAFQGDDSNLNPNGHWNGMYANSSTGLAILRRDGFASMNSGESENMLLTRPVKFSGKYLFVNVDGPRGSVYAEICTIDGKPVPGFTRNECHPVTADSTKHLITWKNNQSLESLNGEPVRIKFHLANSKIYAFWISRNRQGVSGGATAAGGPEFSGTWDI